MVFARRTETHRDMQMVFARHTETHRDTQMVFARHRRGKAAPQKKIGAKGLALVILFRISSKLGILGQDKQFCETFQDMDFFCESY